MPGGKKKKKKDAKAVSGLVLNELKNKLKTSKNLKEDGLEFEEFLYCGSEWEGTAVDRSWDFDIVMAFSLDKSSWKMVEIMDESHYECVYYRCIANPEKEKLLSSDKLCAKYSVPKKMSDFSSGSQAVKRSTINSNAQSTSAIRSNESLLAFTSMQILAACPPIVTLREHFDTPSSWKELNPTGISEKIHKEINNILNLGPGRYHLKIGPLPPIGCAIPIEVTDLQNDGKTVCKIDLTVGMHLGNRYFSRHGKVHKNENVWIENFAPSEKSMMKEIDHPGECKKKVYKILKASSKSSSSSNPLSSFTSYVFKNVIFHLKDKGDWREENLEARFVEALTFFRDCMRIRFMPRYLERDMGANVLNRFYKTLDENERILTKILDQKNFRALLN